MPRPIGRGLGMSFSTCHRRPSRPFPWQRHTLIEGYAGAAGEIDPGVFTFA